MPPAHRTPRRRRRRGFTLIELTAALAIVGLLFYGMRTLLQQLADARDRTVHEEARADSAANGARLLQGIVHAAEAATDSVDEFVGDQQHAEFTSWCPTPGGWEEHCHAVLQILPLTDSTAIIGILTPGGVFDLGHLPGAAHFLYFTPAVADDTWISVWGRSVALPRAIGVATDTYIMVLGTGGHG